MKTALLIRWVWLNKTIFYTAVILGCVIAFSPADAGLQPQLNDKFLHIVGFFLISILCHLAHPKTHKAILFIGLAILGLAIEMVQAYLPYRDFSLLDWAADISGVFVYFFLLSRVVTDKFLLD